MICGRSSISYSNLQVYHLSSLSVNMAYYPPHAYDPVPYMPSGGGYGYDTGYPMPVSYAGYNDGYYGSGYYPSHSHRHHGHRHHHHHRHHSYAPRVFYKHRTIGDRFMGMMGMPQAHVYRL